MIVRMTAVAAWALSALTCLASVASGAETPKCAHALAKMRSELAKRANDMEVAVRDNASTAQTCRLSAAYLAADQKVLAFMKGNQRKCGIAALDVTQQQAVHESNRRARDVLCAAPQS